MPATIFWLLLFLLAFAQNIYAQVYQPGFRTLGVSEEEPSMRLDINIWYPTTRQPREISFPAWSIQAAPNAKIAEGRFPLLVISHATPTDRFAHHNLAAMLAREGYVVAAPTHGSDWMNNMDDLFTWSQLERRVQEIQLTIRKTASEKDLASSLDINRIGLIGFGSGATAALLIGGAFPNCAGWPAYCQKAGPDDVYCSPWAKERMAKLCQNLPLKASLANPGVRAIAAIAPGFGMLFNADSFKYFYPRLLMVTAGKDWFNRPGLHASPLAKLLKNRIQTLLLPEADAGALMAACSQSLAEELPELCNSVSPQLRAQIFKNLSSSILEFFHHYLQITGNLPVIPQPPDLSAPTSSNSAPDPKPTRQKR